MARALDSSTLSPHTHKMKVLLPLLVLLSQAAAAHTSSDVSINVNAKDQYKNWKTKRRHGQNLNRRLVATTGDDDELFFDSNGMPIQHDDDDDIGDIQEAVASEHVQTEGAAGGESKPKQGVSGSNKPISSQKGQPKHQSDAHSLNKEHESDHLAAADNNYKLFNNTHHIEAKQADTIFDDILRGFSFAFLFCICAICLHKLCWYSCIRCGILPDDRLVEARWKRFQLKHKRAYANVPTAMDPRSLGHYFDQRDRMHPDGMGIWDSSAERSVGSWDEESSGAIDFDEGIQLSNWNEDDASTAAELEYGEGEELEDKSHDERLFDVDDGGAGLKMQANKFFDGTKKLSGKKKSVTTENVPTNNSYAPIQNLKETNVSDDAFFDALQPPSSGGGCSDHASESSRSSAQDFVQQQGRPQTTNNSQSQSDNIADFNGDIFDDRGYDEESDLLGLRSDSPPPLDLAEIEKNMLENMENAKSYY